VMTSKTAHPRLDWLRYVKTSKARTKIRHWLAQNEPDLIFDRNIVARKKEEVPLADAAQRQKSVTSPGASAKASSARTAGGEASSKPASALVPDRAPGEPETHILDMSKVAIRIGNDRNIMIRLAQCCTPMTGDAIVGYISRGRGITVHKIGCPSIASIKDFAERSIEVEWETVSPKSTRRFQVTARLASNLFSEIEGALKKFGGHLIEGKLEESGHEMDNREDFGRVLKSLRTIPSIINIQASGTGGT
jgi:guanosine-3',5'-bis(diphosphate) 3'-pyrophosphohydrolase